MKKILLGLSLALSSCATAPVVLSPVDQAARLQADLHDPAGRVMIAAHRGCWHHGPENSLAAIEACIERGIDIVELDLRLTSDGVLILSHDSSLRRMTGDERRIDKMTYAEVARLRLRPRDGRGDQELSAQRVPTFREALEVADRRILLILDLKGPMPQTAERAATILRETGNCDISMFAWVASPEDVREEVGSLMDCAAYLPNLRPEMGPMAPTVASYASLYPTAVAVRFPDWSYLEAGRDAPRRIGARLWVNTLSDHHAAGLTDADALRDPDALWGRLIANGVNMIQTDEPEALRAYLRANTTRQND